MKLQRTSSIPSLLVLYAVTFAHGTNAAPTSERFGRWGVDLTAGDATVHPGDNFYQYANGGWLRANPIPADRSSWGSVSALGAEAEKRVRDIVSELSVSNAMAGSVERKVRDYYRAYMDGAGVEAAGLKPIEKDLARIAAARDGIELMRVAADPGLAFRLPIVTAITLDPKNPDRYAVSISHAGLGLPEREYYLNPQAKFAEIRSRYALHIERMLTLAAQKDAAAAARRIVALETEIAKLHWNNVDRRDRDRTYNPRSPEQVIALLEGYPMQAMLEARGMRHQSSIIVRELDAMPKLAALYLSTPLATWKEYLTFACISGQAELLPRALADEDFDFFGRFLNGQPQQRDRWRRAIAALNRDLGEAVGSIYVARHFSAGAKAQTIQLVENLRRAYGQRIDGLAWMTPQTKAAAREKLASFRVKVGYPEKWRDYTGLEVRPDDAIGNARRALLFEYQRDLARMNQPTDRDEWAMAPQTVNAYYNPVFNEIVFPAAILQPPLFDPNADPAVNYGAIGAVIGHEMGHGFDDQGAKSDANGVLRSWWSADDMASFEKLTARLAAQYDAFEALPGLQVNGKLTLGENIGDNGGVSVALAAYRLSLAGKPVPVLDGYSGEQRFFLAWAQVWRTQLRDSALRNLVLTDPHSPPEFRVNGVVRNLDAWYDAFGVREGHKLYLPPRQRVTIW